ncbi:DUF4190 domain-containing protein [Propionicicella superfundia]|uniref:DUF4190 domain-containing protein n=1 Tax=Propionicicella superfundia TaxID=348582 RepID=UPI00040954B2|nr:DUF4190 domain-containing protein [Propionicicella superfundia]
MSNPYQTPDPQSDPYAAPTDPYAAPADPYAAANPGAAPADPYAAPTAPYTAPADPYGAPTAPYAAPADPYGASTDPYGAAAVPYAAPTDPYAPQGYASGNYNTSPSTFGSPSASDAQVSPAGYGTPAPAPQYNTYESQGYATYGQQTPYAAPGIAPGYPMVLPDHPQATTVLILGILSITVLQLCGPFAWYFGSKARKEIQANPGVYKDGGSLTAGWVMGIIGSILMILWVAFIIIYIIFIVFVVAASTY